MFTYGSVKSTCSRMGLRNIVPIFVLSAIVNIASCTGKQWGSPDAWSRASGSCSCPKLIESEAEHYSHDLRFANIYYSKLLKFIFDKRKMQVEPTGDFYVRKIVFQATEEELNTIETSINTRELDEIVNAILLRIPESDHFFTGNTMLSMLMFLLDHLYVLTLPEVIFALIAVSTLLVMLFLKKKYRFGWICMIVVGCLSFGFVNAYYSCNKKLEIRRYLDELSSEENPCGNIKSNSIFSNFWTRNNPKEECLKYLERKHSVKFPYCYPGEVFMKYFNDILFYQLFLFVENGIELLTKCFEIFKFPYNYIAAIIAALTLPHLFLLLLNRLLVPSLKILKPDICRKTSMAGDKLSGDNLTYFLRNLNCIKANEMNGMNENQQGNMLSKYTKYKSMSSPSLYDEAL